MGQSRRFLTASLAGVLVCVVSGTLAAAELSCRVTGGAAFSAARVVEVTAAAVRAIGSATCDVIYHVDGQSYFLGGCNLPNLAAWADPKVAPLGMNHPRLPLACN
jgi:hypothetical protein